MQPVVSNTSPLIALSILGWLDLPRHFFDPIIIPQAVVSEAIPQGIARPGGREIDLAIKAGWIRVASPVTRELLVSLSDQRLDEVYRLRLRRHHQLFRDELRRRRNIETSKF